MKASPPSNVFLVNHKTSWIRVTSQQVDSSPHAMALRYHLAIAGCPLQTDAHCTRNHKLAMQLFSTTGHTQDWHLCPASFIIPFRTHRDDSK